MSYPSHSLRQLRALLVLRRGGRRLGRLRVLLWLEGYDVDWNLVRDDLFVEVPERLPATEETIDLINLTAAREAARLGSSRISGLDRRWLRSPSDRETVINKLLLHGLTDVEPFDASERVDQLDQASKTMGELLERGLGVYAARVRPGDGRPWLEGKPGQIIETASRHGGLNAGLLADVLRTATDEEARGARTIIRSALTAPGLARPLRRAYKDFRQLGGVIAAIVYTFRTPELSAAIEGTRQ